MASEGTAVLVLFALTQLSADKGSVLLQSFQLAAHMINHFCDIAHLYSCPIFVALLT